MVAGTIGLKRLSEKKFDLLPDLPATVLNAFGELVSNFIMLVWGSSGNGKSNFLMQFIKVLMTYGKVLYISYEEGTGKSMQDLALRHLNIEQHGDKIAFGDHTMTYEELKKRLSKRGSPQYIVIDSLQYLGINYEQYKQLKQAFPRKTFLFISHADGKNPKGQAGKDIRYDACIKVRIEGYLAFISSRYGGNQAYVIWEEGAKQYWGKSFQKMLKKRL